MESLKNQLNCGTISVKSTDNTVHSAVYKFSDIVEKIIPLFSNYPLMGTKAEDLADFKKVAKLMENKAHLTENGLKEIIKIKQGMNRGRK